MYIKQESPGPVIAADNDFRKLLADVNDYRETKLRHKAIRPGDLAQDLDRPIKKNRSHFASHFQSSWGSSQASPSITSERLRAGSFPSSQGKTSLLANLKSALEHTLALMKLFVALPEPKTNCKFYGHVINHETWTEYYPKCADCGVKIRTDKQLRTALPQG